MTVCKLLRIIAAVAVLFFAVGVGVLLVNFIVQSAVGPTESNPYPYELNELDDIDPGLVQYEQIAQFSPDIRTVTALAIDANDRLYIAGGDTIVVTDLEGSQIRRIETAGSATALAVGSGGTVFGGFGQAIRGYHPQGPLIEFKAVPENAVITSLAIADNTVFAADARNKKILKYRPDGTPLATFDGRTAGDGPPHFVVPSPHFDLAVAGPRELWIVNPGRHALELYDPDGNRRRSWERTSMRLEDFCGCCNPTHIALLDDGSIVTAEKGIVRLKTYTGRGDLLAVVATPDDFDPDTVIEDIAVDSSNRIIVLDPQRHAVRIFQSKR